MKKGSLYIYTYKGMTILVQVLTGLRSHKFTDKIGHLVVQTIEGLDPTSKEYIKQRIDPKMIIHSSELHKLKKYVRNRRA